MKALLGVMTLAVGLAMPLAKARAFDCTPCECNHDLHEETRQKQRNSAQEVRNWVDEQFLAWRQDYLIRFFFEQNLAAALMEMSEQLQTTGMLQMEAVGAIFDAREQLDTQQLLQQLTARAHKDYQPSVEMCTLGSSSRDIGAAYRTGVLATHVMARRMLDRDLGSNQTLSAGGRQFDKRARYDQIVKTYCNPNEQFGQFGLVCKNTDGKSTNRDIDYMETVGTPQTINLDFANSKPGDDGQAVLALAANLFGNDSVDFLQNDYFKNPKAWPFYLDIRSIAANRAVAEYSFANAVGMKASGTDQSQQLYPFVKKLYSQLGMTDDDIQKTIGQKPSYSALMDLINRSAYLRPEFYIDLYTKPANIDRIGTAIRAANAMQDWDRFNSQLRSEIDLSLILENEVAQAQADEQSRADGMTTHGLGQKTGGGT